MKILLTLKHWQLFLILLVPTLFIAVGINLGSKLMLLSLALFPIVMAFITITFMGWLYAAGTHLHWLKPPAMQTGLKRFQVFLIIPVVYILLMCTVLNTFFLNGRMPDVSGLVILFIIPLHFFSMFCIFHSIWFVARSLKTAEVQPPSPLDFSYYAGEFFLLWFFPIGIWLIQPRVNRLVINDE